MIKIYYSISTKTILIIALLLSALSYSQPGFDDDPGIDEPVASINGWVLVLAVLGIVYAFYRVKNRIVKE